MKKYRTRERLEEEHNSLPERAKQGVNRRSGYRPQHNQGLFSEQLEMFELNDWHPKGFELDDWEVDWEKLCKPVRKNNAADKQTDSVSVRPKLNVSPSAQHFDKTQHELRTSQPGNKAELDADEVAKGITKDDAPRCPADIPHRRMENRSSGDSGLKVSGQLAAEISSLSGGQTLSSDQQQFFGNKLGADLSGVRVHADSRASRMAEMLNAEAFTFKNNIVFNKGMYNPENLSGKERMAHELAHYMQSHGGRQGGGNVIQRKNNDKPDFKSAPIIKYMHLATWKERLSSAKIFGGTLMWVADKYAFDSYEEAKAYGSIGVIENKHNGSVIIKHNDKYFIYGVKVDAVMDSFSRKNVEKGLDQLEISDQASSKHIAIQAFITKDGYVAPLTNRYSRSHRTPVYITEKKEKGPTKGYWHPTSTADLSGYKSFIDRRRNGEDLKLSKDGNIALFKGLVKATAYSYLAKNRKELQVLENKYKPAKNEKNKKTDDWQRLLRVIEWDKELLKRKEFFSGKHHNLAIFDGLFGITTYSAGLRSEYLKKEKEVDKARLRLRLEYPALDVLNVDSISKKTTVDTMYSDMKKGFKGVREAMYAIEKKIHEDEIQYTKMGPVFRDVLSMLHIKIGNIKTDSLSRDVLNHIQTEEKKDMIINVSTTAGSAALAVFSFFTSGITQILLRVGAAASGAAGAVYNFKQVENIYSAAEAGRSGSKKLTGEPFEEAKFNYIMGWVNLFLAGLDLGFEIRTLGALNRVKKAAGSSKRLAGLVGIIHPKYIEKLGLFLSKHPGWSEKAVYGLTRLIMSGGKNKISERIAQKVLVHGDIPGMEKWVIQAARQSENPHSLLKFEETLDDVIKLRMKDPSVSIKVPVDEAGKVGSDRSKAIADLIADSNPKFRLSSQNAENILKLPKNAVRFEVAGSGGSGADVLFFDKANRLILRREVKCIAGEYNSFSSQLSHAAQNQVQSMGEVFIQVRKGTNVQSWLKKFVSQPGRDLTKFININIKIADELGNIIFSGKIK